MHLNIKKTAKMADIMKNMQKCLSSHNASDALQQEHMEGSSWAQPHSEHCTSPRSNSCCSGHFQKHFQAALAELLTPEQVMEPQEQLPGH